MSYLFGNQRAHMAQRVFELVSSLPPEECEIRLRAAIVRPGPFAWFDARTVQGTVENRWVSLCKTGWRSNGFRPFLRGRVEPATDGTVLRCRLGMHPFTRVLLGLFLGAGAVVALAGAVAALRALADGRPVHLGMLGPCVPLAFGLVTWLNGRQLARGEDQELIIFVVGVLKAEWQELEGETLPAAFRRWRPPVPAQSNGEPGDNQPEWVPSFPVVLIVVALVAVLLTCTGIPVLAALFG
ncbi:MAG TPA: hypothetical protein VGE74_26175 [Gemmata sp.]